MKPLFYRFPMTLIALSLVACSPAQQQSNTSPTPSLQSADQIQTATQTESERLKAFFAESFETDLKRSPMTQSYLGYKWDQDKWDDISPAFEDETLALLQKRKATAEAFDTSKLSDAERLSLTLYLADIARQLENDKFRHHDYIMDQFRAWHTTVPSFLINIHQVSDLSEAQAYIARLNGVKPLFDQLREQLKLREQLGVFPPQWSYDQMIAASENVISGKPFEEQGEDSTLWADFNAKVAALSVTDAQKNELLEQARTALNTQVKPAYVALIEELKHQQTLSPEGDGVWRLPDGDKWYQNRLAWFTTTDMNADQVHQIGLENVSRIHEQMKVIMQKVNFEGDLQAFFEFMRTDPQFYYANTEEGRDKYLAEAKAFIDVMRSKLPDYFGLTPKADMMVKRVEAFREKSAGKAFYQSPAKDGSRPGIYYANLYDMNSMPTYQMEALAYHEGIPGHHMQLAIAQELEGVPEFQKYLSFTAYTEGWGLYTEELAKEMGFYQDPYSDFGRLAMELWRACRLVVDTGIHAKKWSREKAIAYLVENTPNPQADATKAIERYIAMPGQATAYMIGKLKIIELREWAKAQLGDAFDIRQFHDQVLKDGPVPLDVLQEKIEAWVASSKV
ncbi:DUF885 domain-containing protein [Aliiglaciecola sp. CAU 1673]|uniref:DUF885 domain-containing protein n=1 Tax=Aliiglaciecola sp. CAU 1673 TaxID=3032595 RepID=UPI0023DB60B2|nr:DUF885 domain-containing protein [Aliiglaciecola sp. CAU 1673]MDF2177102.1 DUF885 domain-containing protein [Aliiglaciecola sp. CAU 1673]